MKSVKIKFSYVENNMGDMLNVLIPEKVFGINVKHEGNPYTAQSTGIGSYLNTFFVPKSEYKEFSFIKKAGMGFFDKISGDTRIWSTGFISYPTEEEISIRNKNLTFSSVRGELSKRRVENILGRKLDITTGDGGLLSSELISSVEKKYTLGVIPHFKEYGDDIYNQYVEESPVTAKLINLKEEPMKVLKDISECEFIISSSLHGLIVADSFGIPNLRIVTSDKLMGDGFKFDDYYSSFGVDSNKIDIENITSFPTINEIIDNYQITKKAVDNKKKEVYDAFFQNINIKG